MKDVPFDNPFFDELSNYPIRFATPVFLGESPYSSYAASLRNGSATLLKLQDKFLGVTCHHVLEEYRRLKVAQPTIFQLGDLPIDPEKHLVSEDRDHDLAIVDLTPFVDKGSGLMARNFVQPMNWPPRDVSEDDVLCLGGFPGIWREQKGVGYLRLYSFSSGTANVLSVSNDRIVTTVQIQDCISEINHGKIWGSLGGLSGGPVFVWRKGPLLTAELVGFIYEYQQSFDLMLVRLAKVIRHDGTLA